MQAPLTILEAHAHRLIMQSPDSDKAPPGIIFDTAMAGAGDVLALATLYGLAGKGECRVAAVNVTGNTLEAAAYCDALRQFYLGAGSTGRVLPVGLSSMRQSATTGQVFADLLAKRDGDGKPLYPTTIHRVTDTADPRALIRNALSAQLDGNAVVILSGPATNLASVLKLRGARELIAAKARLLVIAAGCYPEGAPDPSIESDTSAARELFAGWPARIVACGSEVGIALQFPASGIETNFAWSPNHPVADACRAFGSMPYDVPARALAAGLYAVRSKENYFETSAPGMIEVRDDGQTMFKPSPDGTQRYLVVNPAEKERAVKAFTELAGARPVPPKPRK